MAEIIEEQGDELRLRDMILLSTVLHIIILTGLLLGPNLLSNNKKIFYSPVYTVSLVSLDRGQLHSPEPWREVSETKPKEVEPLKEKSLGPLRRKEDISKRIDDAIKGLGAIRAIRERQKEIPSGDRAEGEEIGKRRLSGLGREIVDLRYRVYYDAIWRRIREAWVLPEGIVKGASIEMTVALRIKRDGFIESYWVEKGSGNVYFDQSALRAIKKAEPLPPPPEDFREEIFEIGVRFYP